MSNSIEIEEPRSEVVNAVYGNVELGEKDASGYDKDAVLADKFTREMWLQCEKPMTEDEKKRSMMILELGKNTGASINLDAYNRSKLVTIGDLYKLVRISVKNSNLLKLRAIEDGDDNSDAESDSESNKNEKKSKKKKGSNSGKNTWKPKNKNESEEVNKNVKKISNSSKKLIEQNNIALLSNSIDDLLLVLKNVNSEQKKFNDLINGFNFIEYRVIILMRVLEIANSPHVKNEFKEEALIGSKKIYGILKEVIIKQNENPLYTFFNRICQEQKFRLSEQLVIDLKQKIDELLTRFPMKISTIAKKNPKLVFHDMFEETIPENTIKPHDSQIEFCRKLSENISNGVLMFYKTLTGLGKTTMIASACSFMRTSPQKLKVIFCCSDLLQSVRIQVLKMAYNVGIKFGIATYDSKKNNYIIKNHNNCQTNAERELIVADYKSTYLILKEHETEYKNKLETTNLSKLTKSEYNKLMAEKNKYLLFFDEPTILTDNIKNKTVLTHLSKILNYMPAHTILSSATLPLISELSNIVDFYRQKYPDGLVTEVVSNKTLVGCFIKDFESSHIIPHYVCKNTTELGILLEKIKNFPLIGKFYTLPFLINLNDFMKKYNQSIDIDNIDRFEQDNIFENIITLLNRVLTLDQIAFDDFLKIEIKDIKEEDYDMEKLNKIEPNFNIIMHSKLLTTQAFKFMGCCLIATDDPEEYVRKNFTTVLNYFKKTKKIISAHENYKNYKRQKKEYDEKIDEIEANFTKQEKRDERINKLTKPALNFPKVLEINSTEHMNAFSQYVKGFDRTLKKESIDQEELNILEFDVSDNIKLLLQMGVGIFSKNIDDSYKNKVIELLSDRKLAYIIADESFCYGANYPISHVIITDELGDKHSINTILQLIGRTSRIGKSWSGTVYLDINTKQKILELFKNPTFNSEEGINISRSFGETVIQIRLDEENEIRLKQEKEKKEKLRKELELARAVEMAMKGFEENNSKSTKSVTNTVSDEDDFASWRNEDTPVKVNTMETPKNTTDRPSNQKQLGVNVNKQVIKSDDSDDDWGNLRDESCQTSKSDDVFVVKHTQTSQTKSEQTKSEQIKSVQTKSVPTLESDDNWSIVSNDNNKKHYDKKNNFANKNSFDGADEDWDDLRNETKHNDKFETKSISSHNGRSRTSTASSSNEIELKQSSIKSIGKQINFTQTKSQSDDIICGLLSSGSGNSRTNKQTEKSVNKKNENEATAKPVKKVINKTEEELITKPVKKVINKTNDEPVTKSVKKVIINNDLIIDETIKSDNKNSNNKTNQTKSVEKSSTRSSIVKQKPNEKTIAKVKKSDDDDWR